MHKKILFATILKMEKNIFVLLLLFTFPATLNLKIHIDHFSRIISMENNSTSQILSDLKSLTKVQDFFYLYWTFNSNNTVTLALRWSTGGYFALGFGTSMDGMDVIAAEKVNGSIILTDRYATTHDTPSTDEQLGGTNDVTLVAYILQDEEGFSIMKLIRKLSTGDQYDYIISQKTVYFCYAYSSSPTLEYHGDNKAVFTFDFIEGQNNTSYINSEFGDQVTQAHAYGNLVVWGFLAEISVIIARHFKSAKYGIDIHATIFLIINLWTLIMAFWIIGKSK